VEAPNPVKVATLATPTMVNQPTCWPGYAMGLFRVGRVVAGCHQLTGLVTSLEQFRQPLCSMIEESMPILAAQVKRIRWQHGAEEIQLLEWQSRFLDQGRRLGCSRMRQPTTVHHG
jgi:hypothetical protein